MRVLFTSTPGWGHLHPMVPLARAFAERGDEVRWAVPADVCPRLAAEGFATVPAGLGEAEGMGQFAARFAQFDELTPAERPLFMFPRLFGAVRAGPMLADLLAVMAEGRPDLVVNDAADLAAPIAASRAGVPHVTHGFGVLLPPERLVAAGEVVAPLWEAQGLEPRPYCGSYEHPYLDIYPPSLAPVGGDHVRERQSLRPVPFASRGDDPVPGWLAEEGPPLVYVTFGTVFNKDVSTLETVVEALRDLPVRVLVTVGPRGDPAALGPQPGHVLVARYVPQTEVLSRATLVVSHAGSGTFLAGLSEGLPHLCLPRAADQFDNAAACARSGCGIVLLPHEVDRERVGEAVGRLLAEAGFREAAGRLRRELAEMPPPEAVAALLADRFG